MAITFRRLAAALLVPGLLLSGLGVHASPGPAFDPSAPWRLGPLDLGSAATFAHPETGTAFRPPGSAGWPWNVQESGRFGSGIPAAVAESGPAALRLASASVRAYASRDGAGASWTPLRHARQGLLSSPCRAPPVADRHPFG